MTSVVSWGGRPILEPLNGPIRPPFAVYVKAKSGMIVAADRPVAYMRGWELRRAVALAERWHWKLTLSDDERTQLVQQQQ